MIKLSTLFWLVAVSTAGFAMFAVKYEVQSLADQLARTVKQADDTERDIRALDAEWAYLNRPDALAQMNQRFLSLVPIATKQLRASVADIPMRPSPPPVETVAAADGTAVAQASASESPPAGSTAASPAPAAQIRPAQNPLPVASAAQNTQATPRPVKSATIRAAVHPSVTLRVKSLNQLIAQIAESR